MKDSISARVLRFFHKEFRDEFCNALSVKELFEFENGILEQTANINEELLSQRHQRNSQIIKTVKKNVANTFHLAGFYILYPLRSECEELIENGSIRTSRQIATNHIGKDSSTVSALYLSMVYGKDQATQGYLIYLLYRDIKKIIRVNRAIRYLYVRPVTEAGFRAVEKHQFRRFREDSGIYRRAVQKNEVDSID